VLAEISEFNALGSVQWTLPHGLSAYGVLRYWGPRNNPKVISATNSDVIHEAWVSDVTVNWRFRQRTHLQMQWRNVGNERYFHPSNLSPDRYRQPQRQLLMTLRLAF
jgi:outer membrane receptor for monomeric catechols